MRRSQKRLLILASAMLALIIASALLYMAGMAILEGKPRDFWRSLAWAGETLSSTGYGGDSSWGHPAMVIFVVANGDENATAILALRQAGFSGDIFALSISQVSGQLLAARLLERETISVDAHLRILKSTATGFEGRHPSELGIREKTGASVVAVERGDDVLVHFDADFAFAANDAIYVCGSENVIERYLEVFAKRSST